jgi:hypothetical protein
MAKDQIGLRDFLFNVVRKFEADNDVSLKRLEIYRDPCSFTSSKKNILQMYASFLGEDSDND